MFWKTISKDHNRHDPSYTAEKQTPHAHVVIISNLCYYLTWGQQQRQHITCEQSKCQEELQVHRSFIQKDEDVDDDEISAPVKFLNHSSSATVQEKHIDWIVDVDFKVFVKLIRRKLQDWFSRQEEGTGEVCVNIRIANKILY